MSVYSFFDVKQISSTDMNEWNHDCLDKVATQIVHTLPDLKHFLSFYIIKIWKLNYYSYENLLCILFCISDVVKQTEMGTSSQENGYIFVIYASNSCLN